jgi:hypothetical protein
LEFFPIYLPGLERLSLQGCSISNVGLVNLFHNSDSYVDQGSSKDYKGYQKNIPAQGSLQRLKYLNISECFLIDDAGLLVISQNARELQELEVRGLNRITLAGLNICLRGLTELEKLDIRGVLNLRGQLNGDGLEELKISIQSLEVLLNLQDLRKLEVYVSGRQTKGFGDILVTVVMNNQNLEELILVKDNSLGMYSLEDLDLDFDSSAFPNLKITLVTDETSRFT